MKYLILPFLTVLVVLNGATPFLKAADAPPAEKISLWTCSAPIGDGQTEDTQVFLTLHRPSPDKASGAAIVICPGGGYGGLVTGPEGHGIAQWLNEHGVAGLVLEYRLPKGRPFVPLLDAQRALRLARHHSEAWGIHPQKLGIIGFSAGGHLASTAATHFDDGQIHSADPVNRQSCRPDFAILVYPVVSMLAPNTHSGSKRNLLGPNPKSNLEILFSNELQVSHRTPPIFLTHAVDDRVVGSENSQQLYKALQTQGIPTQYLELPRGDHGLNGYQGEMWDAWQQQSLKWLQNLKFIP